LRVAAFRGGRAVCLESEGSFARMGPVPSLPDVYIGDLKPVRNVGFGHTYGSAVRYSGNTQPPQKDKSNLGRDLKINRQVYQQGMGVHAPCELVYEIKPEFKRFVEAQLTWDRAMAQALAGAKREFSDATIVGVLGSGHVADGHGVPHQLKDLGVTILTTLIPESVDTACRLVGTSYADIVFTLPPTDKLSAPERPRLGVLLVQGDGAPRINNVARGSVAEAVGLQTGDHVVRAAGLETRNPDDLVEIVGRQAPGTWLPLSIRRDGQEIDLIAKFPTRPREDR